MTLRFLFNHQPFNLPSPIHANTHTHTHLSIHRDIVMCSFQPSRLSFHLEEGQFYLCKGEKREKFPEKEKKNFFFMILFPSKENGILQERPIESNTKKRKLKGFFPTNITTFFVTFQSFQSFKF